jgi:hypothetical protein
MQYTQFLNKSVMIEHSRTAAMTILSKVFLIFYLICTLDHASGKPQATTQLGRAGVNY